MGFWPTRYLALRLPILGQRLQDTKLQHLTKVEVSKCIEMYYGVTGNKTVGSIKVAIILLKSGHAFITIADFKMRLRDFILPLLVDSTEG